MLDALIPALEAGITCSAYSGKEMITVMSEAATKGALETAKMKSAKAGRSAYVGEVDLDGNVDPGAMAVAYAFQALAEGIKRWK